MDRLIAAVMAIGLLAGCTAGLTQDTARKTAELEKQLPVGGSLAVAEVLVKAQGLPYTVYSAVDCEKNAKITSPSYTVNGGPCLFALARVGQTWYGYTTDLEVRLFFDSSNILVQRDFNRIDTFI
jgi:hypothetical protein